MKFLCYIDEHDGLFDGSNAWVLTEVTAIAHQCDDQGNEDEPLTDLWIVDFGDADQGTDWQVRNCREPEIVDAENVFQTIQKKRARAAEWNEQFDRYQNRKTKGTQ